MSSDRKWGLMETVSCRTELIWRDILELHIPMSSVVTRASNSESSSGSAFPGRKEGASGFSVWASTR